LPWSVSIVPSPLKYNLSTNESLSAIRWKSRKFSAHRNATGKASLDDWALTQVTAIASSTSTEEKKKKIQRNAFAKSQDHKVSKKTAMMARTSEEPWFNAG
jgi:hypothetical protein